MLMKQRYGAMIALFVRAGFIRAGFIRAGFIRAGFIRVGFILAGLMLAGCATESASIDISGYAPVIDVKGQGYDVASYHQDLDECRMLGMRVQASYEAQRKREVEDAQKSALIGVLAGAVLGQVVGDTNDYHTGRSATTGAIYGGAIGAAAGADNVDYSRTITKFGPTGVVDRCMRDRGYKILSAEGFGGG